MANIHLIGGEKGGVGKSVVARVLAQYMIDKDIPFVGFDTDQVAWIADAVLHRFRIPMLVDSYESLDTMVELAAENPEERILVDLAAQTHERLVKWIDESGVLEALSDHGLSLTYWHVMDSGKDSVALLKSLIDRFGSRLNYVIVLNQLRGDNFDLFEKSGEKAQADGLQREDRLAEAAESGRHRQDRRREQQLLVGAAKEPRDRQGPRNTPAAAREGVAATRLSTNRQRRYLTQSKGSAMNKELFDKGLAIRKSVIGAEFVDKALATADDFNMPLQELVTEYCWGAVWGREGLEKKTRSLLNIAMLSTLNRPHELKVHVKGAIRNGATKEEIREVLLQVAIYAGVPAAVDSFRVAKEALGELEKK